MAELYDTASGGTPPETKGQMAIVSGASPRIGDVSAWALNRQAVKKSVASATEMVGRNIFEVLTDRQRRARQTSCRRD